MKRNNKNKKKKGNFDAYAAEDHQELTRKDGMKKNHRRRNRHSQKRDLKHYIDNS